MQDEAPRLISAANPGPYTGDGNNTWLIDGAEPTLVDAGAGVPAHVDAIASALGGRALARVLVTHGHADHASGAPALRARWPRVICCKQPHDEDHGHWRPIADGDLVRAGDRELVVVATPGHAPDHVCFWDSRRREAYTGDLVRHPGSVLIPGDRGGNLRQYLASLDRVAALDAVSLLPGHGAPIDRPRDVIAGSVAHRLARERQVLASVAAGAIDVDAIVERLYAGLDPRLRPAARSTVQAHLDKLREEGRLPA